MPTDKGKIPIELPTKIPAELRSAVSQHYPLAWSEYDLNQQREFTSGFVILTSEAIYGLVPRPIELATLKKARTIKMRGYETLEIHANDLQPHFQINYTRRHRSSMSNFARQLNVALNSSADNNPTTLDENQCLQCGASLASKGDSLCKECLNKQNVLGRLLPFARPYRKQLISALILTFLVSSLSSIPPYCYMHLIDDGIRGGNTDALMFWGGVVFIILVVQEALGGIQSWYIDYLGIEFVRDLRSKIFEHLQNLGLRYFQRRRTGSLITRTTSDVNSVWSFVVLYYIGLIRDGAMILIAAGIMFSINWWLSLLALFPIPFLGALTYWRKIYFQGLFNASRYFYARLYSVAADSIPGVRVVKAFGAESREADRFRMTHQQLSDRRRELDFKWALSQPMFSLLMKFASLSIWLVGGYAVIRFGDANPSRPLTLGVVTAFTSYLWQFYGPVIRLTQSYRRVAEAITSAHRILDVLNATPDIQSKPSAVRVDRFEGRFELENISFSYDRTKHSLENINLSVHPGEMIGVCGPSGAGKTTLLHLICRFYDPSQGQIRLDGRDLRDYHLEDLRRNVSVVLQEPYLFYGSILDNIRFGNPDASFAQIVEAARAAEAHDFIMRLDSAYDSIVGERGITLSGGERQRISIARALIRNPTVLILDEATSSLDVETESRIRAALDRLIEGRTTFAIAHRLSTLRSADRLLVLDQGKIAEVGTHAELLAKPEGLYTHMHKTQQQLSELTAVAG
ncbi:MAG: ABC transporter ATP-binding protein/permease [Myxococcales bacterium]|nr:ABC transporter ATP-binding protein/permease [Myxococcales bacterium]